MSGHAAPQEIVRELALQLLVMVLSLSVHECAHAWAAFRLGDDTAARQGRLSLSPVTHVDPIGTLLIPAVGVLLGGFGFIGWARPTPVNPTRFRKGIGMRWGMAIVAAAGPLSNLLLALLALGGFSLMVRAGVGVGGHASGPAMFVVTLFYVNVGLAIFNLLPLPPLDGSQLLPRSFDGFKQAVAPYSFLLLMVVINVRTLREPLLEVPFRLAVHGLQSLVGLRLLADGAF